MPTLADLNRQRRDYAFSGQAGTADIPYLYELAAARRAQQQGGLGGDAGGGLPDAGAAPNPLTLGSLASGGGASGAADVGVPGPGLSGLGEEFDDPFRAYLQDRGSDRGFGGPDSFDRGLPGPATGFTDISGWEGNLIDAAGYAPGPFGWFANAVGAGIRGSNLDFLNRELERYGLEPLSTLQGLGAITGRNEYGSGSADAFIDAVDRQSGSTIGPTLDRELDLGFYGVEKDYGRGAARSRGSDRGGGGGGRGGRGDVGSGSSRGGRDRSQRD